MVASLLVAGLVAGMVILLYSNPVSTTGTNPNFYLQQGPDYSSANTLGLFTAVESGTPSNVVSGTTIDVNTVAGSEDVYLLNVLDVYNATSALTSHVYLYINGTLSSGVTMYYGPTHITATYSAGSYSLSGTAWTSGTQIALNGAGPAVELFLAFALTGSASGSGTLYFSYVIA